MSDPSPDAPASPEALFGFINEVMILSHLVTNAFEGLMGNRLSLAQFSVLNHLWRVGDGQSPARIAQAMQVRKSTMTSTLGALLAAGLVTIVPDKEDRRAKRVHLTPMGHATRAAALQAFQPELMALGQAISQPELQRGLPVLERLRKVMDARRDLPKA